MRLSLLLLSFMLVSGPVYAAQKPAGNTAATAKPAKKPGVKAVEKTAAPILTAAESPENITIAAAVNDTIVSTLDVDNRVRLILGTTGIKDSPEIRQRLRTVALRALIDEKLQLEEAANNGVTVGREDLAKATAGIEQQRGKPIGSLRQHLMDNNLPVESFEQQISAQIAWARLLAKKVRARVKISDAEIQQARERLASTGPSEVQLSVILLPLEGAGGDDNARKLAERLVGEIRSGASFDAVAGQFGSAAEPFWTDPSQLDPAIGQAIAKAKPGQITDPIRTLSGYQIVRLIDVRKGSDKTSASRADAEVALRQILLSLKPDADKKEAELLVDVAKEVQKNPGSCTEEGVAGLTKTDIVDIKIDWLRTRISGLAPQLQAMVQNLSVGDASAPFATPEGIRLMMLCEKMEIPAEPATAGNAPSASLPDAEEVKKALYQQKLELESAKYLRNLRREAFIDVRMK